MYVLKYYLLYVIIINNMGGGVIQLVAYGAQDIYLTGNPQITFFKAVYKRHTMFAIENFPQLAIGNARFGNKLTYVITRKADLLGKSFLELYLEFKDEDGKILTFNEIRQEICLSKGNNSLAKSFGYSLIDYIEIEINGTKIDRHTGHWMAIQSELTKTFNERINDMFLHDTFYNAPHISENAILITIPLQFWFNKDPGLYLPLVALQYHEVKINVKLNNESLIIFTPGEFGRNSIFHKPVKTIDIIEMNLNCDYIYLDTEERKRFAQNSHEYLIEQVQMLPGEHCRSSNTDMLVPLTFNHPIKEIIWTIHDKANNALLGPIWSGQKDRIKKAVIQLNGVDRFPEKPGIYFQTIQKSNHHTGIDLHDFLSINGYFVSKMLNSNSNVLFNELDYTSLPIAKIDPFIYSFALEPQKHQPSGSCNFSRLDNAVLSMTLNQNSPDIISDKGLDIRIYGLGYNVLRIVNGMGGLAYSN